MTSINRARGEVAARFGDVTARLCVTLGALAEIETALGLGVDERLAERLKSVSARDLTVILAALLRGGGLERDAAAEIARTAIPEDAARAVAEAFLAAAGA